jgi:hypothetical protein
MSIPTELLALALVALGVAIVLFIYLAVARNIVGIHRIWEAALGGDKAARAYSAVILLAFILAFVSVILMKLDS